MKVWKLFSGFVFIGLTVILLSSCQSEVNTANQLEQEIDNMVSEKPEHTQESLPEPTETPPLPTDTPVPTDIPVLDLNNIKFLGGPRWWGDNDFAMIKIVTFSPDGEELAYTGSEIVKVIDWKSEKIVAVLDGHTDDVEGIVWTPDGNGIISASLDGTVILWEIDSNTQSVVFQTGPVYSLDISPDGSEFVLGQDSGIIKFWDIVSKEMIASISSPTGLTVNSISWSVDGSMVACGEESGAVYIIDPGAHEIIHTLSQDEATASSTNSLAWSPDGKILASGHQNGEVFLWDTDNWELIRTIDWNGGGVGDVTWIPNSSILTISGETPGALLWDIDSGENIPAGSVPYFSSSWSPDGRYLALSGSFKYGSQGHDSIRGGIHILIKANQ